MAGTPAKTLGEIDEQIAAVRENLRDLIEQAAADSGASDEQLIAQRIAEQESLLQDLMGLRDDLSHSAP
jgi:ribosome-binding protein aMBF1 (putative translation factor)